MKCQPACWISWLCSPPLPFTAQLELCSLRSRADGGSVFRGSRKLLASRLPSHGVLPAFCQLCTEREAARAAVAPQEG